MKLDEDELYSKITGLDVIYHFIYDNFLLKLFRV